MWLGCNRTRQPSLFVVIVERDLLYSHSAGRRARVQVQGCLTADNPAAFVSVAPVSWGRVMKQLLVLIVTVVSLASAPLATRTHAEPQSSGVLASTSTTRLPTLEDAYAVKTIGALEVSPNGTLAAFEISGGITVQSLASNGTRSNGSKAAATPRGRRTERFSRFSRTWKASVRFISGAGMAIQSGP